MATPRGVLVVVLSCLCIFLMGSVAFGIGLVAPTFYLQGLWVDHCGAAQAETCTAAHSPKRCCDAQFEALDLVMTIAFFLTDAMVAVWGEVGDRIGPRTTLATAVSIS